MAGEGAKAWYAGWALAGSAAGVALQLQQVGLWPPGLYASVGACGLLLLLLRRRLAWLLAGMALALAATGWRALSLDAQGLAPELEGRSLLVQGRIASLPQTGPQGERFELAVESASLGDAAVRVPPRLLLSWYSQAAWDTAAEGQAQAGPPRPALTVGDRWVFTLRLKRAHGSLNPHGFDRERWLWERGIRATGYVREGPHEAAPQRLGASGLHPVDRLRQRVSVALAQRLGEGRSAGVIAALVVGEQSAIVALGKRVVR